MALTKIPASLLDTSSGINGLIYPSSDGTAGQFLKTDGSGNLTFATTYTDSDVETYLDGGSSTTTSTGATVSGTLTVTGDLDITGDINSYNVTDLDVTDQTITLGAGQTEANSGGSGIIIDGSSASILWDETNDVFDINKGLTALGKVGIGQTDPDYQLSIGDGTGTLQTLNIKSTDASQTRIFFSDASNNAQGRFTYDHSNDSLQIATNDIERMRIDTSGKVGIGTSSPSATLELNSDTANATKLKVGRSNI